MFDFFFSYARAENDKYLQKFFEELSDAVRRELGKGKTAEVAFFDQRTLERGDVWEAEILDALNSSACVIALYSPSFFNSEFCLREVNTFRERQEKRNDSKLPGVIIPVTWYPIRSSIVPAPLRAFQYSYGDPASIINTRGVLYSRRRARSRAYDDLLLDLAKQIAACSRAAASLPGAAASAPVIEPAPQRPPNSVLGPGHVRFIYVASSMNEPGLATRQSFYGADPNNWKPYLPDTRRIGALAQRIAGEQDLTSDELKVDKDLLEAIREAEKKRNLVVMIVDGWSVEVAPYSDALLKFDERNYANCAIVAPWNIGDPLTQAQLALLQQNVRRVLDRWSVSGGVRFNDASCSLPQFQKTLADTLTALRAQVFNSNNGRPAPSVPRPILTNAA